MPRLPFSSELIAGILLALGAALKPVGHAALSHRASATVLVHPITFTSLAFEVHGPVVGVVVFTPSSSQLREGLDVPPLRGFERFALPAVQAAVRYHGLVLSRLHPKSSAPFRICFLPSYDESTYAWLVNRGSVENS